MAHWEIGILCIFFCAFIEGFAQVSLKKSTKAQARMLWIGAGVLLFVIEAVSYTSALQWLDISTAYPLSALSFIFVTLLSAWLLCEAITGVRWLGVGLIMCGCALMVA